jgi:hypothetical protein
MKKYLTSKKSWVIIAGVGIALILWKYLPVIA